MRRYTLSLLVILGLVGVSHAEILTLYSDKDFSTGIVAPFPATGPAPSFDDSSITPPEGVHCLKLKQPAATASSWALIFPSSQDPQSLARFNTGELRFWLYVPAGNPAGSVRVEIVNAAGVAVLSQTFASLGWTAANSGQWVAVRMPLAGVDLTSVELPVRFAFDAGIGPLTYFIDDIRYVDSTVGVNYFHVDVETIGTGASVTDFSFNTAAVGAWTMADQQVKIEMDPNIVSWGLQIYTNNTVSATYPFTPAPGVVSGNPGSNPAGLVDTSNTSRRVPLAWKIQNNTVSLPLAWDPNYRAGDPAAGFGWHAMLDAATPTILQENTIAFSNELPYAMIMKQDAGDGTGFQGIHWGPGDFDFGIENPPVYLFLEGDFRVASTPNVYQTSSLTIEFFSY